MPSTNKSNSNLEVDFPLKLLPKNTEIVSVLANGMFSTVYKAAFKVKSTGDETDSDIEMPFVVKHIKSSNHPKRVLTEMCLLSKLRGRHHIIPVWSLVNSHFSYLVMMPYFSHDSFSSFFRDLTRREIANYLYALLDALSYIHALNVTHRDIKPTNFLYNRKTKRFALIDFGLAEKASRSSLNSYVGSGSGCEDEGEVDFNVKPPALESATTNGSSTAKTAVNNEETSTIPAENVAPINSAPLPIVESPKKSIFERLSPPIATLFSLGRVPTKSKGRLSAASIRRRLRFSDILNVEGDEKKENDKKTTNEASAANQMAESNEKTGRLSRKPSANDCSNNSAQSSAVKASLGRFKSSDSGYSTASSSRHHASTVCKCDGPSTICGFCQKAPEVHAQRSGTTGYRAPEVLLRSQSQTIAIDVWAAGVVFLIILSGRYPFFTSKIDLEAICQLMTIFGRRRVAELASELNLLLLLPSNCPVPEEAPLKLGKLCKKLRASVSSREIFGSSNRVDESEPVYGLADKNRRKRTFCQAGFLRRSQSPCENYSSNDFDEMAFDLLEKLLEIRPSYRLSATAALKHALFRKYCDETVLNV